MKYGTRFISQWFHRTHPFLTFFLLLSFLLHFPTLYLFFPFLFYFSRFLSPPLAPHLLHTHKHTHSNNEHSFCSSHCARYWERDEIYILPSDPSSWRKGEGCIGEQHIVVSSPRVMQSGYGRTGGKLRLSQEGIAKEVLLRSVMSGFILEEKWTLSDRKWGIFCS